MLDLLLIAALGFLGSFGHCAGMCGPLTVAFSLSQAQETPAHWWQQLRFHSLLNLGRMTSYALVGGAIGALGSVLVAGGQMAGVGSLFRQGITLFTGSLLVWFGLAQIRPGLLPRIPVLHPLSQANWHSRLSSTMTKLSLQSHWWTPALLGVIWGLLPCGFLYIAQIKAADAGGWWAASATMLAFGLGTFPVMLGVGTSAALVSADRRSQFFRLGGWVTLAVGLTTLLRTGETMVDYSGHASLFCLMLALAARPLSYFWPQPLRYRRILGVSAFILALAHAVHMLEHTLNWNLSAIPFLLPYYQVGIGAGVLGLVMMMPAAMTSFDRAVHYLGKYWRKLHLLSVPALLLCTVHTVLNGSHYLGGLEWTTANELRVGLLAVTILGVLLVRSRTGWALLSLERFYVPAKSK